MARSISDEELQLKRRARRRLIGAIVLVTAVVVVLPMVLDTEPKPIGGEINIKIPSSDTGGFTSRVVPVAPSGETKPESTAKPAAETKSGAKVGTAPESKKPTASSTPVPAPSTAAAAPEKAEKA